MYLTLFVIVAILVFIYIQIRPHLSFLITMIEFIRKVGTMSLDTTKKVAETVVDETAIGSKLIVNAASKPTPEESRPSKPAKGYCYVGEWKGVRSCVKVDNTPCKTQVYSTMQQCVNPTLR
jgi:hypothetical protein